MGFLEKIFGNYSEKEIKKIKPIVAKIEALGPQYENLSDEELRGKTQEFKDRLAKGETLDDILPEAYAVVREAASRPNVLNMKHFPVQLMGGIVMHQGRIAEMRTGEGKTLVATLPAYLNALEGKGVHVVTVNDYLAQRDSDWMGEVFRFLGLSVGCILNGMDNNERARRMPAILPMVQTMSSALTTCVTTWWYERKTWCRETCIMPSSTRLTLF